MKQAAMIELFSYWDSLRAGLERTTLDAAPEHLRPVLANTFLVEVDARRAYPLRVVGATLPKLTANARLGASFLECWSPAGRPLVEDMLQVVHEERLAVVLGAVVVAGEHRVPVEALLLPLVGKKGAKPRILGGLAPGGSVGRRGSPAPLEIVSARAIRTPPHLEAMGFHAPETEGFAPPVTPQIEPQVARHVAPHVAPPAPARRRTDRPAGRPKPRLRVIEGGRSD